MTLAEAIAAIQAGHRVGNAGGSTFWLEHDAKGRPMLMGEPAGYGRPVRHLVFGSEHFRDDHEWRVIE